MRSERRAALTAGFGVLVAMADEAVGSGGATTPASLPTPSQQPAAKAATGPTAPGSERTRWIVSFAEAPVAAHFAGAAPAADEAARQARLSAYAATLRQAKEPRLAAMRALGAAVLQTAEFSANTAVIELPAARAAALAESIRQLPGVAAVQPSGVYRADPKQP